MHAYRHRARSVREVISPPNSRPDVLHTGYDDNISRSQFNTIHVAIALVKFLKGSKRILRPQKKG